MKIKVSRQQQPDLLVKETVSKEAAKSCRENMDVYIGLARTEHETECHEEKLTSVFCITKLSYQTSFLRAQTPYRRERKQRGPAFLNVF